MEGGSKMLMMPLRMNPLQPLLAPDPFRVQAQTEGGPALPTESGRSLVVTSPTWPGPSIPHLLQQGLGQAKDNGLLLVEDLFKD